jgi:hypothetical protein
VTGCVHLLMALSCSVLLPSLAQQAICFLPAWLERSRHGSGSPVRGQKGSMLRQDLERSKHGSRSPIGHGQKGPSLEARFSPLRCEASTKCNDLFQLSRLVDSRWTSAKLASISRQSGIVDSNLNLIWMCLVPAMTLAERLYRRGQYWARSFVGVWSFTCFFVPRFCILVSSYGQERCVVSRWRSLLRLSWF